MNLLITGGAGFIGSHITEQAIAKGWTVSVLDNFSTGKQENLPNGITVFRASVTDYASLLTLVKTVQPNVISHQAAQPSLRTSLEKPEFDALTNIIGTINVIKAAREVKAHVILASTSAVYDADGNLPYLEDDDVSPTLPYGISKCAAELYLIHSGLSYTVFRYGNVYGERQVEVGENQLVPHCLNHLLHGKPFAINGDGTRSRDFVYVGDVARANLMAAEAKPQGIYNIATGTGVSVQRVCNTLASLCGKKDYAFEHGEPKAGEAVHTALDSTKAHLEFGWKAETFLEEGLRKVVKWEKSKTQ